MSLSKRVLIVDDEPDLTDLFATVLTSAGFEVIKASDGSKALASMKNYLPDLVLLDVQMPNMDGFETLGKIRTDDHLRSTRVIIVSNMQGQDYLDKATNLGADDYWYKANTHLVDLVDKVKKLLS